MGIYDQQEFDIRFEWGLHGVEALSPISDVVIIVDVLSFSTCVDIATARGASVYPYRYKDDTAKAYAQQVDATLAGSRGDATSAYSLSPASLLDIPSGTRLVLPSPNGATLSLATGHTLTLCGCLRNARAIANFALKKSTKISVIAAGERWPDGILRPSWEDMIGAGAIISYLHGSMSPECQAALAVYKDCTDIQAQIMSCSSGKELISMGYEKDVALASELNVSSNVPVLIDGAYISTNSHLHFPDFR